jgi:hypothetical protein
LSLLAILGATSARAASVAPTRISLPQGPASIEGLGRSFVPSLASGTAAFGVDIAVPPSAGGFAPKLSLDYDGGAGVSELGAGWRLTGAPSIRVRTENGLPKFDGSDAFELVGLGIPSDLLAMPDGYFRAQYESGTFARSRTLQARASGRRGPRPASPIVSAAVRPSLKPKPSASRATCRARWWTCTATCARAAWIMGLGAGSLMAFAATDGGRVARCHRVASGPRRGVMAIVAAPLHDAAAMALDQSKQQSLGDASDDVVVDELFLTAGSVPQGCGGEPVYFAERTLREFMQGRQRVVGEEGAFGAGGGKPKAHVFSGIFGACVLLGIIATCRALRVSAQAYLAWAFEQLGTHRAVFDLPLEALTPAAFKKTLA